MKMITRLILSPVPSTYGLLLSTLDHAYTSDRLSHCAACNFITHRYPVLVIVVLSSALTGLQPALCVHAFFVTLQLRYVVLSVLQ